MFDTINTFLDSFTGWLLDVLPKSPFQSFVPDLSPYSQYLGWLNWFVDFQTFALILIYWLAAIAVFYLYRAVIHWTGLSD